MTVLKISTLGVGVQFMDSFLFFFLSSFLYSHLQFRGQISEYCLLGGGKMRILR